MAVLWYGVSGDLSALTPKTTVHATNNPCYGANYYGATRINELSTARYIAFTPSAGADVPGVLVELQLANVTNEQSVTLTLQESVLGVWTDRAAATKNYDDIVGADKAFYAGACNPAGLRTYFEFAAPYTVTAVAATWRVKVQSTNNQAYLVESRTSDVMFCVVPTTTDGAFTPGDDIVVAPGITVAVDATITITNLLLSTESVLSWAAAPAASYTLTITTIYTAFNARVAFGSEAAPIPYASQAVLNITNVLGYFIWGGDVPFFWSMYGELPTDVRGTIVTATSGQRDVVMAEDYSATWQVGDTLWVFGVSPEAKTITNITGTTVQVNTNLGGYHSAGWAVINETRMASCGIRLTRNLAINAASCHLIGFKSSGVYAGGYGITVALAYASSSHQRSYGRMEPLLVQHNYATTGAVNLSFSATSAKIAAALSGSVFGHLYALSGSSVSRRVVINWQNASFTLTHMYISNYVTAFSLSGLNSTISDVQVPLSSTWAGLTYGYTNGTISGVGLTVTRYRASAVAPAISGFNHTFTDCTFDGHTAPTGRMLYFHGSAANIVFNNCSWGQTLANTHSIDAADGVFVQAIFNDCTLDASPVGPQRTGIVPGSYFRMVGANSGADDHRSYEKYGRLQSVGAGLTDTTVHTAGAGKFGIRFQPTSSTNRLEWAFATPTGNIQGRTMTVAVWCKINAAAYYAGVHQKPRLTVRYDNATDAYSEAAAGTGWQLLSVTFTPTTTYGQITVTLSGMTDATGSDAYIYYDDFAVLYPAGYALDLGGMDLWADALPITPPIATVASPADVWLVPAANLTGVGTIGKRLLDDGLDILADTGTDLPATLATIDGKVTALPDAPTVAGAVWDHLTAAVGTVGSVGRALLALITGRYHYDRATGVETLSDADGNAVSVRTVVSNETEVTKQ